MQVISDCCKQTRRIRRSWPSVISVSRILVSTEVPATWPGSNSTPANAHLVTMATNVKTQSTRVSATRVKMAARVKFLMTMDDLGSFLNEFFL